MTYVPLRLCTLIILYLCTFWCVGRFVFSNRCEKQLSTASVVKACLRQGRISGCLAITPAKYQVHHKNNSDTCIYQETIINKKVKYCVHVMSFNQDQCEFIYLYFHYGKLFKKAQIQASKAQKTSHTYERTNYTAEVQTMCQNTSLYKYISSSVGKQIKSHLNIYLLN